MCAIQIVYFFLFLLKVGFVLKNYISFYIINNSSFKMLNIFYEPLTTNWNLTYLTKKFVNKEIQFF